MTEKIIKIEHEIGEIVYLVTDSDQKARMITSIIIRPFDILYELSLEEKLSNHYDFEIVKSIDILKKLGINEPI